MSVALRARVFSSCRGCQPQQHQQIRATHGDRGCDLTGSKPKILQFLLWFSPSCRRVSFAIVWRGSGRQCTRTMQVQSNSTLGQFFFRGRIHEHKLLMCHLFLSRIFHIHNHRCVYAKRNMCWQRTKSIEEYSFFFFSWPFPSLGTQTMTEWQNLAQKCPDKWETNWKRLFFFVLICTLFCKFNYRC